MTGIPALGIRCLANMPCLSIPLGRVGVADIFVHDTITGALARNERQRSTHRGPCPVAPCHFSLGTS